jgi:membrane protein
VTVTGRAPRPGRGALRLLAAAGRAWSADRASRLGAALAYYSLFALVPVLFLAIGLAGLVVGEAVADSTVEERIADVVGPDIAHQIATSIDHLRAQSNTALVPLVSLGALIVTASVLFVAWRDVVDLIWGIPRQRGLRASLRRRLFGVLMIVGSGVLLALMIFSQTMVGALEGIVDNGALNALVKFTGSLAPSALGALFLAALFELTPDTEVSWRSVWAPALLTMAFLSLGAWAYGLYLGTVGFTNASGVAGSLLLGLALVYYATQILLFGVELTKVIQRAHGAEASSA